MGAPDLADADAGGGDDLRVGIELGLVVFDHDDDVAVLHQADRIGGDGLVDVLQQLQAFLRIAQAGAQGGGVLQAHPGEAGDAHAHAVFVDAGVHLHLHGDDVAADGVVGVGGGQSHAHRLGAAQGGDDLLAQQCQQFFFGDHRKAPPFCSFRRCVFVCLNFKASSVPTLFSVIFRIFPCKTPVLMFKWLK